MDPKYPNITAKLTGESGNALAIISGVMTAMRRGGINEDECEAFKVEAMSGDYDNVLKTALNWVEVA